MGVLKVSAWANIVCCLLLACGCFFDVTRSCGVITHIEISQQALENYKDIHEDVDYSQIASSHQDALEAGSAFPDSFYPPTCFLGKFSHVSEDTHWTQFLNASILYINRKHPKPWDTDVQKLVAFLLGVVSHQVADVLWHSLGIDQGFIQTMAKMNFHDVYSDAHPVADAGGDILNVHQLNLDYSALFGDWYVPVDHLTKIYRQMYRNGRVNKNVVRTCSQMLYTYKIAARLAAGSFFPIVANQSPFLVDHLYDYFQGGVADMAAWTRRIWKEFSTALDNNLENCHLPKSSLFVRCNATEELPQSYGESSLKNGFYAQLDLGEVGVDDVIVEETQGGVYFKLSQKLKDKIRKRDRDDSLRFQSEHDVKWEAHEEEKKLEASPTLPDHVFTTDKAYAQLGSAFAVGDLNGDSFDDLAVGSAGAYPSGVVYVIYGSEAGIPTAHTDIEQAADVTIRMPADDHSASSLFGASLATFDLDQDGELELVVGAPSYRAVDLLYQGRVFIFSLNSSSQNNASIRATVDCPEKFCNFGYSLHIENSTGLGLMIGAPFAPAGGAQRGAIAFLPASAQYAGQDDLQFIANTTTGSEADNAVVLKTIQGEMDYEWRGYSLNSATVDNSSNVMFGGPGFRDCANTNCAYSPRDSQSVGQVVRGTMDGDQFDPVARISREKQFLQLGAQLALGQPLLSSPKYLAVSGPSSDVAGQIFTIDFTLKQAGVVYFFSDFAAVTASVSGDRNFARFGDLVKYSDLTNDGLDELVIGAPLWTRFLSYGVQEGRVYIYGGGDYPTESDMSGDCGNSTLISPCPEKRAYKVLTFGENLARFGTEAISLKSSNTTSLFVTAAHSSWSGRLAGAIGVFDFPY
ncbi:hypothetical protein EGW08_005629 [Elysia chlorotica]|uniref:Phosphatidylinositol-glycan-specific phospholipase D n=1 Tax=Elysia chlorotica TaxID=188477 RepID=A0A433TYG4_ELYCH|nr:hypothetical protein EGW08_005629 [Elysia chlorotica]